MVALVLVILLCLDNVLIKMCSATFNWDCLSGLIVLGFGEL